MYLIGSDVFTRANKVKPLASEDREKLRGTVEEITIWEMNKNPAAYLTMMYTDLPNRKANMVDVFVKIPIRQEQ
jgi:hypothetical protein